MGEADAAFHLLPCEFAQRLFILLLLLLRLCNLSDVPGVDARNLCVALGATLSMWGTVLGTTG